MLILDLKKLQKKFLIEEQCIFNGGRGCTDQIFTVRFIIDKCLSYYMPLVLRFINYEQVFDSADRKALAKGPILVWYTRLFKVINNNNNK